MERENPQAMELTLKYLLKLGGGGNRVLIEYKFNSHYIKSIEKGQRKLTCK